MTRRAIVLSGGGARGAYEAGVLSALLERCGTRRFAEVICGTSVGAITGAHLAASLDRPVEAAAHLEEVWSSLSMESVVSFGPRQLTTLPGLVLGGAAPVGLFDGTVLARTVARGLPLDRIAEQLASGRLAALTVTATHVPSGRPYVFVQRRADVPWPERIGRRVVVRDTVIGLPHVLASASIPLLFPPVEVDGELYCDGGLRLNTPLGPAIRLGADRVLAIALSSPGHGPEVAAGRYPGASFLLGKMLNAFLLDHVMSDLDELYRINRFLADGAQVCGPDFADRMSRLAESRGQPIYRTVHAYVVRPSVELPILATEHLRRVRRRLGRMTASRAFLSWLDTGEGAGSDLASYLLFDREYARDLLELGRHDGRESEALEAFLT